ncbi:MAG: hypothetical protein EHM86_06600 [Desulfobulbaceae bacterium]|nr:MAG: hypothetical protein EHM86_06600 [Desulfobulbaceae bacterium]
MKDAFPRRTDSLNRLDIFKCFSPRRNWGYPSKRQTNRQKGYETEEKHGRLLVLHESSAGLFCHWAVPDEMSKKQDNGLLASMQVGCMVTMRLEVMP